ncbi:MAG: hypothetical protein K9L78_00100, partial [Victivallales bacterium]|nr:hypothetical protein [Victivallales bacterium]
TEKKTQRRALFSRRTSRKPTSEKKEKQEIDMIKIKGHSLIIHSEGKKTPAERFKENLLKSNYTSNNSEDIKILKYTPVENPKNNITTFSMNIKLRKTLKEQ